MEICFDDAVKIYNSILPGLKCPSHSPYYVVLDAKRDESLKPVFWVYIEGDSLFYYGFHISKVESKNLWDIQSPYGYGGPLATTNNKDFLAHAWTSFIDWCKKNKILAEFVRFHPLIDNWGLFCGTVIDDRQTVYIDLEYDDLLMSYSTRVRTAIRKAANLGLRVEWWKASDFLPVFINLYESSMRALSADEFYFFTDSYYRELINSKLSHLAACILNDKVVAAAVFLLSSDKIEYHLSASDEVGKRLGATNLIIHNAAIMAKKNNCKFFHLGGGISDDGNDSLFFFKSGFSKLRSCFKIGKYIHDQATYDALKSEFVTRHGAVSNKVLFYRFKGGA